jgi:SAM-dependent methyltransferase
MLICPDCHRQLADDAPGTCPHCAWEPEFRNGVPIFLSSSDRNSQLFAEYLANYDRIAAEDLAESIQPQRYLAVATETLSSYIGSVRGKRVCELGVGQGALFEKLLGDEPETLTAFDIAFPYIRRLREAVSHPTRTRTNFALGNAENLPYAEEFDLIVASEILEHVLNAGDLLISLHRALRSGGRVAIRVPYKEDLRQYARQRGCPYAFVHLRTFTRDSLVDLMRHAGFRARRIEYDGYFEGRQRRLTPFLYPLLRPYFRRSFHDGTPHASLNRRFAWFFLQPPTLTAIFEKT